MPNYIQPDDPRILIFGSRLWIDRKRLNRKLDNLLSLMHRPVICHGNEDGADKIAEEWAFSKRYNVMRFHADWRRLGKEAGAKRNVQLVKYVADRRPAFAICFGEDKYTPDLIRLCRKYKVKLRIIEEKKEKKIGTSSQAPPKYLELRRRARERRSRPE